MFHKNNLAKSSSPYLKKHKKNPIHWQEWNEATLEYAKKENKPLFVSVGYATCHWCHVMAREAFSDHKTAKFLNKHVVCVKVDREQRPDIDSFLMSFIQATQGQGGWPLNVLLSPDHKPFFALTYAPVKEKEGIPSFMSIMEKALEWYNQNKESLSHYIPPQIKHEPVEEKGLIDHILKNFDLPGPKFPPHNTLLFLLNYYANSKNEEVKKLLEDTLETITIRGLHDHLQGGFYRYCVDPEWTIPHFEKMLYDQAMMLWVFSSAYKSLKKDVYSVVCEILMRCLEESFEKNGMFVSAHDADTGEEEGATYVWASDELKQLLTEDEFDAFEKLYHLTDEGNFEGKHHLIKKKADFLPDVEEKLLSARKNKSQPFIDEKIITSWNALTGIGLIHAFRFLGVELAKEKATKLFENLLNNHFHSITLAHSSFEGKVQEGEFLEDYASFLLFTTYMVEETGEYMDTLKILVEKIKEFKKEEWVENKTKDFKEMFSQTYDHPIPSSVSLAEFALFRANLLLGEEYEGADYKPPLHFDFFNLLSYFKNGNVHVVYSPDHIEWEKLPLNCIQIKSNKIQHCFNKRCIAYDNVFDLVHEIQIASGMKN